MVERITGIYVRGYKITGNTKPRKVRNKVISDNCVNEKIKNIGINVRKLDS